MVRSAIRVRNENQPVKPSSDVGRQDADNAGVAFRPPFLLAASVALAFGARWIFPFTVFPPGLSAAGPIIVVASFALFFGSAFTMQRNGGSVPTGKPTDAIVGRGPYRFSRNPIYLSMLCLQMGLGLWANSGWFFAFALSSFVLLSWGVISREERYLEGKFSAEYLRYKSRVRRWF